MAFSLSKKDTKKALLVFDVGNGSVGGGLVMRDAEGNLKLISSSRADIPTDEQVDFGRLFKGVLQAIDSIAPGLTRDPISGGVPIFVVLASPWYISQTKMVSIKNERTFTFSRELCDEIMGKEMGEFKESLADGDEHNKGGGLRFIESQNIRTTLNGYEAPEPYGKKASEAVLALYMSVSEENVISGITQRLNTHFPHSEISFHSFPLAYFNAVWDTFPGRDDFILLDVSGEITDVSLVRKGVLMETVSFPMGRNFILRRVASGFKRTIPEALSLTSLFLRHSADADTNNKMAGIISALKKDWLAEFQKILTGLSGGLYVPSELFLTVDDDVSRIFSSWVKEEEFSQHVSSYGKFKLTYLPESFLSQAIDLDGLEHDQFLNIGILFADKIAREAA